MKRQTFNLVFESDPKGGYTVTVPALPGCVTYGATMQEAKTMAREAIELYLEDMAANGEDMPSNGDSFLGSVEVEITAR